VQCTVAIAPFFVFAGYKVCKTAITSAVGPFPVPAEFGFENPVISSDNPTFSASIVIST
jgi:hypothetical protein